MNCNLTIAGTYFHINCKNSIKPKTYNSILLFIVKHNFLSLLATILLASNPSTKTGCAHFSLGSLPTKSALTILHLSFIFVLPIFVILLWNSGLLFNGLGFKQCVCVYPFSPGLVYECFTVWVWECLCWNNVNFYFQDMQLYFN